MKKYKVYIKRIGCGFIKVEAEDKQGASDAAITVEAEDSIIWDNNIEMEIGDIEEIKQ